MGEMFFLWSHPLPLLLLCPSKEAISSISEILDGFNSIDNNSIIMIILYYRPFTCLIPIGVWAPFGQLFIHSSFSHYSL